MLHFRDFSCAEEIRHSGYKNVEDGGWHFSFMGGVERIREKLAAYAHQERNLPQFTNPQFINERINQGAPLGGWIMNSNLCRCNDSFPHHILEPRRNFPPDQAALKEEF